jgi:hypothetical protein
MRKINRIICHHSGTNVDHSVEDIDEWHKGQGWDMIGYHYAIDWHGRIVKKGMRPDEKQGAHTKGENQDSIGVVVFGVFDFTISQYWALGECLFYLKEKYGLNNKDIYGHSDFNEHTLCPSYDLDWVKKKFIKKWGMKWNY